MKYEHVPSRAAEHIFEVLGARHGVIEASFEQQDSSSLHDSHIIIVCNTKRYRTTVKRKVLLHETRSAVYHMVLLQSIYKAKGAKSTCSAFGT